MRTLKELIKKKKQIQKFINFPDKESKDNLDKMLEELQEIAYEIRFNDAKSETIPKSKSQKLKEAFEDLKKHPEKYPNLPKFIMEARKIFGVVENKKFALSEEKENHTQSEDTKENDLATSPSVSKSRLAYTNKTSERDEKKVYISECCKGEVEKDQSDEGTFTYVCQTCEKDCDVICSQSTENKSEDKN